MGSMMKFALLSTVFVSQVAVAALGDLNMIRNTAARNDTINKVTRSFVCNKNSTASLTAKTGATRQVATASNAAKLPAVLRSQPDNRDRAE